ncbi:DUF6270 domain-containing protein [Listeria kieliensis]|uniref:Uncharacterized protein n=1 Tax=Listeria kieliensis TaxID=1621700 RepID=A0A3D8TKR3_9LIST|nr:DUF6270 domain-containing protein [Listeria kieliensis]RDW99439.1 hypothetical protein UR08_11430 [Listeria kieliensis]
MVQKIGVLGTCFSRNFLNSNDYFNPEYKKNYTVVFTQFHSSLITLMTEPFFFEIDHYEDIPPEKKKFVVADFEKTFFQKLKQESPDFLMIDLYADALKKVAFISAKQAVTISPIIEQSRIQQDLSIERLVSQDNWQQFLNYWLSAVRQFKEKISPYLDEEQLILNQAELTTRYIDEKGRERSYENLSRIAKYNQLWRELDQYFLTIFPKAKVINMRGEAYIGDVRYPFGHSVSHYQSDYYKKLYLKFEQVTRGEL